MGTELEILKGEEPKGSELETIGLTLSKLNLQWIINKAKNNPKIDYFDRIQFAKFALEETSGQKVKLNIRRHNDN